MKQSFFFTFFIINFPEGAIQRQYNYLLSTEEKKLANTNYCDKNVNNKKREIYHGINTLFIVEITIYKNIQSRENKRSHIVPAIT